MIKVRLFGILKEKYLSQLAIETNSIAGVIDCLIANFGRKFKIDFLKHSYQLRLNKKKFLKKEELGMNFPNCELEIIPCEIVSGGEKHPDRVLGEIAGIGILFLSGGAYFAASSLTGIGANLLATSALGAVYQKLEDPTEPPDERQSTDFFGSINNYRGGGAIPIVYGEVLAGSTMISLNISNQPLEENYNEDDEVIIRSL